MRDYDGKTADDRVAERRARLIAPGVELFGEHGYAGTSIRSVLRQSGSHASGPWRRRGGWRATTRVVGQRVGRVSKDVVELVIVFFDAVADRVGD